jgi:hypothetical protein
MPRQSHSQFDHANNIWWGVQILKFLIMQFSPFPCYLVPLRSKYSPQYPVLNTNGRLPPLFFNLDSICTSVGSGTPRPFNLQGKRL